MPAKKIEIILSRQFADCLSVPVFITDPEGNLIYYNEDASEILGKRFEDTGFMPVDEWSTMFNPQDGDGNTLAPEELPLVKTLTHQIPAQGDIWIKSLNGKLHHISITSFPIVGLSDRYVGAIAIFFEIKDQ